MPALEIRMTETNTQIDSVLPRTVNTPRMSRDIVRQGSPRRSPSKWAVVNSRIKAHVYMTDDTMLHLDPLLDASPGNTFLSTVAEFLKKH
jgi:hypothetical protein